MNIKEFKIGENIAGMSVSGNYIVGKIIRILENTIIVSNGIETELLKKDSIKGNYD